MLSLRRALTLAAIPAAAVSSACQVNRVERTLTPAERATTLDRRSPFLKAHMRSGHVAVLSAWSVDTVARVVSGTGTRRDPNRVLSDSGGLTLPFDSVVLFETNVSRPHPSIAAMTILTGASLALTIACAENPKSCFGSCPTFYLPDGGREVVAEGFSASIAPSLEATDVDALYTARPRSRRFRVRMTNEALETHVVRRVRLLVAPRPRGGRVFATQQGEFWSATGLIMADRCEAAEGDCTEQVRQLDGVERFSTSDATDLAVREFIELQFSGVRAGDTLGLVLGSRQTLLSTYLFYQALAWMGTATGHWLAAMERGDSSMYNRVQVIDRVLGGIEVQAQAGNGEWLTVGEAHEAGPLATDVRVIPLPPMPEGTTRLRLRLTRGHWRLDYIALARLDGQVHPTRLESISVRRDTAPDERTASWLRDTTQAITTFPGDRYDFEFELPHDFAQFELFLESRGYYLEWMRAQWLLEENLLQAFQLSADPAAALRGLAPAFKAQEAQMEAAFWGSRYARP